MKPSRLFRLHFLTFLNDCERTFIATYKERKDFKDYKKASLMAVEKELSDFLDAPWVNEDKCKGLKIYLGELQHYLNDSEVPSK